MELLVPILEKFGPTGLTIIMMGGGLVYLTRWLREMQAKIEERDTATRKEFGEMLKEKRVDFLQALTLERTDYLSSLQRQRDDFQKHLDNAVERFESAMHEIAEDVKGVKIELGRLGDMVDNVSK